MTDDDYSSLTPPSKGELKQLAASCGFSFNEQDLEDYTSLLRNALDDIEKVLDNNKSGFKIPENQYARIPIGDSSTEDPLNAWLLECRVEGSNSGPLSNMTIGLKDNIALAGYEMTCGSRLMKGYVPQIDATVVTRLLDAGGTIVGKLNMESFAWSGSSDTSDFGTVPNPHDDSRLAGGSSSGSGAAVAAGGCDIAIGSDQGGSIRIPAAWCGVVGIKPTTGLVPYTGAFPLDPTIDHLGPLTSSVRTAATALEAMAGDDIQDGVRLDDRQPPGIEPGDYVNATERGVDGMKIGILEEGFCWDVSEPEIDDMVRETIDQLESAGATANSVSAELHRSILSLLTPMESQGGARIIAESGHGIHQSGWYWEDLITAFMKFKRSNRDQFPPTTKLALLIDAYLRDQYGISVYAKAKNIILQLEQRYNELLNDHDVLVMPTVPIHPFERDMSLNRKERVGRIVENHRNTAQFDHTHHPALSVPCGSADGFPVGFQVVGSHFDEESVFRVAKAVEDLSDWDYPLS